MCWAFGKLRDRNTFHSILITISHYFLAILQFHLQLLSRLQTFHFLYDSYVPLSKFVDFKGQGQLFDYHW